MFDKWQKIKKYAKKGFLSMGDVDLFLKNSISGTRNSLKNYNLYFFNEIDKMIMN